MDTAHIPAEDEQTRESAPAPRTRTWLVRTRRTALALVLAVLLPLLAAETALRVNYGGDLADGTHTRNQDAIWLGHAWIDGRKSDADVEALAGWLRGTGIRDLYVHSGPWSTTARFPPRTTRRRGG